MDVGKVIIVINGRGGAGKDTLCEFAAEKYRVVNVSSIDPIKKLAAQAGWNGEKDDRSRRFLSDLKALTSEYNDLPTKYLADRCREFLTGGDEVMFVHIRECEQIAHFIDVASSYGIKPLTLLVRRGEARTYGNVSDDNVEQYPYDFIYENDKPLGEARGDFLHFFEEKIAPSFK